MKALGEQVTQEGIVYWTGGACALHYGWREVTIGIDLQAEPEPRGFFRAIASLKDDLDINVELASPDLFIPVPSNWQDRSPFIIRFGKINYYHYDFYSQALSKMERGHSRDWVDVEGMFRHQLIEKRLLWTRCLETETFLIRYPAVDPTVYRKRVEQFCLNS